MYFLVKPYSVSSWPPRNPGWRFVYPGLLGLTPARRGKESTPSLLCPTQPHDRIADERLRPNHSRTQKSASADGGSVCAGTAGRDGGVRTGGVSDTTASSMLRPRRAVLLVPEGGGESGDAEELPRIGPRGYIDVGAGRYSVQAWLTSPTGCERSFLLPRDGVGIYSALS